MFVAAFLIVILIIAIAPGLQKFTTANFSNAISVSGSGTANSLNVEVWSPLQNTTLNKNNTGFFAQVNQFTGYAFVLPNIGLVVETFLNVPRIIAISLSTALSVLPLPDGIASVGISLFITFCLIFAVSVFISLWMKADLLKLGSD